MHNEIIFDGDNIIGYSWDIDFQIRDDLKRGRIDEDDVLDLLDDLKGHDGLVICKYHPMGAWVIRDLVEA